MTEDKKTLGEDDIVVVVQCDAIRLIGTVSKEPVGEDGHLAVPFQLLGVGAVLITRGVAPGAVEGVINQVKQINIATLDYATGPLEAVGIERASLVYTDVMIDDEGRKEMRAQYEAFLNRKGSVVQHARTDGNLP
jgi:hypothetical protein